MAELLIKAVDHTHPDPVVDRQGAYKRGMVVRIEPDGFQWGAKEGLPKFVVLHVPGVEVEEINGLLEQQTDDDNGVQQGIPTADGIEPVTYRRRTYKVDIDDLPENIKTDLTTKGRVTAAENQIMNQLKRIRDGKILTKRPK